MGTPVDNSAERVARRSNAVSPHNEARAAREREYELAKDALQKEYQDDIRDIEKAKGDALEAAGLNRDGTDPRGRPTG